MRDIIKKQAEDVGTVGACEKLNDDTCKITRAYYRQGLVFKSFANYLNHPDLPCYVPELSDTVYTGNDFLKFCNGQQDFADELFEAVDWQHMESQAEDWIVNDEWRVCKFCGTFINYSDGCGSCMCPVCKKEVNEM